jgi:hypothetical protein
MSLTPAACSGVRAVRAARAISASLGAASVAFVSVSVLRLLCFGELIA